ncbi:TPA: carbohydrate porin [Vibrio parahaemolyticus]|nr:carbohydrate porin [Vibrio parahaemolyticus]HBC3383561.1 carbohydrate porin [Vibrio parahaemolyticus]HBC3445551.1 carbohydrate porin [Vibrio parahaemolyticus]HBC3845369.1 carbohydrate porin [Vibrio parahaemolyticus]HBH7860449.1 carbohydrate porin [Vibrio parahaemolyticus]
MKNFKVLPITLAVAASLSSVSAFAAESNVADLEKRIQELEAKVVQIDYVNDQQQAVLTPDTKVPEGLIFSGYARYGAHYSDGDSRYVNVGSSGRSVGRLGNEGNGGEFQIGKIFQADNGAKWDIVVMFDEWAHRDWGSDGGVSLKKAYAGVTNVFDSQPELYMWAGRDFHGRQQQGLNDYFLFTHDGQGAGFNNLNLGGAKLDMGFVGKVDSNGGSLNNDNGVYAITSKLHGINAGIGNLDLYFNYGFASDEADAELQDETSWQVGATLGLGSSNKLVMKYADGADDSAFDLAGDKQVLYTSLEGNYRVSDQFIVDYLVSYKNLSGEDVLNWDGTVNEERNEYSAIMRPQYQWDEVHSTWLEAGYAMEDHDSGKEVTGWKVTLSQNVSLGGLPWSRPMLRFYTTVGDVTTDEVAYEYNNDTLAVGAMFEAWW